MHGSIFTDKEFQEWLRTTAKRIDAERAAGGLSEPFELVSHSTVELQKHNAADVDVAYAAWVSNFGSEARERDTSNISKLIEFLYSNKHMSPFEHGSFTWFVDSPIFVAREFMRHRTWSYNETSGRYKELEGRFYLPPSMRPLVQVGRVGAYTFEAGTDEQFLAMKEDQTEVFTLAWNKYKKQLRDGVAKEVARNVLPLATMTQFYGTANPRNVMQFLALRNDKNALYEIRAVAQRIEEGFAEAMPLTYGAYAKQRELWVKINRVLELMNIDDLLEVAEGLV